MQFSTFNTKDNDLNRLQANCSTAFSYLFNNILKDITLLENITLNTGPNMIETKLGKAVSGWIIVRIDSVSDIKEIEVSKNIADKFLNLHASVGCKVSILIF